MPCPRLRAIGKGRVSEQRNFGRPWLALCVILAVHVADEALTDFLSMYNPAVTRLNDDLGFTLLPIFTFPVWIGLLVFAVVGLCALTPLAYKAQWGFIPVGYAFASIMLINGLSHLGVSLWHRERISGVYTAPLLLAGGIYLWTSLRNLKRAWADQR